MALSGRSETFQQSGKIDNADLKFTNSRWELVEGKRSGKETVRFLTDFEDTDGGIHPWNWVALGGAGMGTRLTVDDGEVKVVNDNDEEVDGGGFADSCGVAKLFASLETAGFPGKKLDKLPSDASLIDGQWVHVEQALSGRKGEDGKEFSDLVVTELLDEDDVAKGGKGSKNKSKSSSAASSKKSNAKSKSDDDDDEEEPESDDEDEENGDEEETDEGDPIQDAADSVLSTILSDPSEYVNNFNAKKNDGGVTVKELYTAGFKAHKGKNKGEVTNLLRDSKYLAGAEKRKLCRFDDDEGVVFPVKKSKK